jgi:hypothetical protein
MALLLCARLEDTYCFKLFLLRYLSVEPCWELSRLFLVRKPALRVYALILSPSLVFTQVQGN